MSPATPTLRERAFEPGDRPELFEHPALFLSASVPYERDPEELTPEARRRNLHYVETSRPDRIRAAVTELCRWAFSRDLTLIFGGHPAISPMVLAAARRFVPAEGWRRRVLVFQSLVFEGKIPEATLKLGDWRHGEMLWTRKRPERGDGERQPSLEWMREVMVRSPKLLAAVCIGGMEGVEEEARIFRRHNDGRPVYAIGSTGSAARDLFASSGEWTGGLDRDLLASETAYSRVFRHVFSDLEGR